MKKLLLVFALAAVVTPAASAGGWATVGLSSLPPDGLKAGQPWPLDITVLQHGRTPLAGVAPVLRIRDDNGKVVSTFTATPTGKTGVYHTVVRFPASGTYSYEVYDGFATYGGAKTHTFKAVTIGDPGGGSFPYLPSCSQSESHSRPRRSCSPAARAGRRSLRPSHRWRRLHEEAARSARGRRSTHARGGRPGAPRRPAGCWATVGLSSLPKPGLQAGEPWVVTIRVLQHGRTPLAGAKPEVRIRNRAGKLIVYKARALTSRRLLPRQSRLPCRRPLVAQRLRRLRAALCERAHVQVGRDRPGLTRCRHREPRLGLLPGLSGDICRTLTKASSQSPRKGATSTGYRTKYRYNDPEVRDEMAAAELTKTETERDRITRWRTEELVRAGFEPAAASLIAARLDVDLHDATDLLRAGCSPELALQILL